MHGTTNLFTSGDMLFCKFCQNNIDWKHVDTYKDHLQSKKYVKNKENTPLHSLLAKLT